MKTLILAAALAAGIAFSPSARAACCPGYTQQCAATKSLWCIQNGVPAGSLPQAFCSYGDKVVSTLESVFNIPAPGIFEFELDVATGGAHTGTACGNFGDGVAYDAFNGTAYGAIGFWGYLLSLHEAINDWTGMASGGWPTDWWADHQSAFPNLMDFHIMNTIGVANGDQNLIKAAAAQKMRFYPGGDTADPKVVALDNVFSMMPGKDGYAGFSHMFAMQSGDGVKWDNLGVANPDVKRSEYVVAYMSLAAGQPVLKTLQGPGANGGGNICNGTPDGTRGDAPYVCSEAHIDAIATAHCAIAASGKPASALTALRAGNYAAVPSGHCGAPCPNECACDSAMQCVAPWLGTRPTGDAGAGGADGGSNVDATTSDATFGAGGDATAGASSGGGSGNGSGSTQGSGASGASGGAGVGSSGTGGYGATTGSTYGADRDGGFGAASGSSSNDDASASPGFGVGPSASGCSCEAAGSRVTGSGARAFLALVPAILFGMRTRRRLPGAEPKE